MQGRVYGTVFARQGLQYGLCKVGSAVRLGAVGSNMRLLQGREKSTVLARVGLQNVICKVGSRLRLMLGRVYSTILAR